MTPLALLHPLDTATLANILNSDAPEIAIDWLIEGLHKGPARTWNDVLLDVLLLYARDRVGCPDFIEPSWGTGKPEPVKRTDPDRLLDTHFTEALLARWLVAAASMWGKDEAKRSSAIGASWVANINDRIEPSYREELIRARYPDAPWEARYPDVRSSVFVMHTTHHATETEARLTVKRAVLGLFDEIEREVGPKAGELVKRPDGQVIGITMGTVPGLSPVDFLPAVYGPSPLRGAYRAWRDAEAVGRLARRGGRVPVGGLPAEADFLAAEAELRDHIMRGVGIPPELVGNPVSVTFAGQDLGVTDQPPTIQDREGR